MYIYIYIEITSIIIQGSSVESTGGKANIRPRDSEKDQQNKAHTNAKPSSN